MKTDEMLSLPPLGYKTVTVIFSVVIKDKTFYLLGLRTQMHASCI